MKTVQRYIYEDDPHIINGGEARLIGSSYHHALSGRFLGHPKYIGELGDVRAASGATVPPSGPQSNDGITVRYLLESLRSMSLQLASLEDLSSQNKALRALLEEDMATREEERKAKVAAEIAAIVAVLIRAGKKSQQAAVEMIDNQIGYLNEKKKAIEAHLKFALSRLTPGSYLRPYIYNQLIVLAQIWAKIHFIIDDPETAKNTLDECAEMIKRDAKILADSLTANVDPRELAPDDRASRKSLFEALEHIDGISPMDRLCDYLEKIDLLPERAEMPPLNLQRVENNGRFGSPRASILPAEHGRLYRRGDLIGWNPQSNVRVENSGYLYINSYSDKDSNGYTTSRDCSVIIEVPCKDLPLPGAVDVLTECGQLVHKARSLALECGVALEVPELALEFGAIYLSYRDGDRPPLPSPADD